MGTLLNIAALARRTGVAPDTLRKWELRYGVLAPRRTTGGQRRYSETDVQRVEWMRDRIRDGWRAGEAARLLDEATTPAYDDPGDLRDALVASVSGHEPAHTSAILDQAFAVLPLECVLADVIAPALRWAGDAWHGGRLSIAQEHAVTATVRSRLDQLLADARGGVRGIAVLACAPGELHDIGLLMLAVLLRGDGWRVEYLGADLPVRQAVDFAGELGASVLCLSAARLESLTRLREELRSLGVPPPAHVVLGGGAVSAGVASALDAVYAGHRLDRAVDRLRRLAVSA